eukprot:UN12133
MNAQLATLYSAYCTQLWMLCSMMSCRTCTNKCCHYKDSKCKYLNFAEYMLTAMERSEDRPNTLLWLETQIILVFVFLFGLTLWWEQLDAPDIMVLVPQIVLGLGDGLAEPVGVKWGRNHQYRTTACCSKHKYVRSYPGSAMVLLSGYLGVGVAYSAYTLNQFIIAMAVVPIIGTVVEAKAPHTLDNPCITLFVGIAATLPLYIDL